MRVASQEDVVDLYRRAADAAAASERHVQQAARLVLVARNLRRGEPHPWRRAAVSGGAAVVDGEIPVEHVRCTRRFPARPEQVHAVRMFVAHAAREAGVDAPTAVLAASELAANAVVHAATPFVVTVVAEPGYLRAEVADGSSLLPVVQHVSENAVGGRGMAIVEAVSEKWGVDRVIDGKVVWFELAANRE